MNLKTNIGAKKPRDVRDYISTLIKDMKRQAKPKNKLFSDPQKT